MVVFTCNNCGETLQKPKVAKHYEFRCHTAPFLTCVDCFKDFRGEEYVAHTKCITEAERYGGKDYVQKASANKGERKQQEWINVVNNVLKSETDLSNAERNFLNLLLKHENIPRKRVKFLNFVKSAIGNKTNPAVVNSVWDKMETAYKNNMKNANPQSVKQQNGKTNEKTDHKADLTPHQENNVVENQNNENIDKENQNEDQQNKNNELNGVKNGIVADTVDSDKKKKSKKRMVSEARAQEGTEPVVKKKCKNVAQVTEESIGKKKNKHIATEELAPLRKSEDVSFSNLIVNQCDDAMEKLAFSWKDTILDIVKSKGEISLKKLQKKVISRYMNSCSNTISHEKAYSKFNKKLKKVSEVVVSDETVSLA
ncbi:uncharacterized protein LOC143428722 [Xylocopa sonorina]|uniref:uncharacterized protein LOC143428722 n=1 Tax=Xylocopa sonorina TaxID=1818115 RepID=UPI00403ADE6A